MEELPEFVTDAEEAGRPPHLTGWESVVFQLDDEPEPGLSPELSTAAMAP